MKPIVVTDQAAELARAFSRVDKQPKMLIGSTDNRYPADHDLKPPTVT